MLFLIEEFLMLILLAKMPPSERNVILKDRNQFEKQLST